MNENNGTEEGRCIMRQKTENVRLLIRNRILPYTAAEDDALQSASDLLKKVCGTRPETLQVVRRSVDARRAPRVMFVYTVLAGIRIGPAALERALSFHDISLYEDTSLSFEYGSEQLKGRPVIAGFGPCGMFCAMILAENGYSPIIIERGGDIEERAAAVKRFYETRCPDPDCNVQFGAGGAGTFSDGKLLTRINDPLCTYVLRRFVEFGAPPDILVNAKPHVGTDNLCTVVRNIEQYLLQQGCEIRYHTRLDDLISYGNDGVTCSAGSEKMLCGALVLATGHSARDTYRMLMRRGIAAAAKPFSAGVRIEHLQADINRAVYAEAAEDPRLPPAEYTLSAHIGGTGVYSFCMCPGGEVIAAASEEGGVVTNGMSHHARNGPNANAALAVSVRTEDFGGTPEGAINFQRRLEEEAFQSGGGDYSAPCETVGSFLGLRTANVCTRTEPSYWGGRVRMCGLASILPQYISRTLAEGLRAFDRKLPGFASPDALLTGVETRTSAPLRLTRDDLTGVSHSCSLIYPCGEGAGYAGGITSAAVDGIRCAMRLMKRFRPF